MEWIPVANRPFHRQRCLVYAPLTKEHIYMAEFDLHEISFNIFVQDDQMLPYTITHWMPLPDAPLNEPSAIRLPRRSDKEIESLWETIDGEEDQVSASIQESEQE